MNERIKKLAEQAGFETNGVICSFGNYKVDNEYFFAEDFIEDELAKFAELIVRDTLDQVVEFDKLTKAYLKQGIDPEIDVTKEVLKNYGFTRFPIGVECEKTNL